MTSLSSSHPKAVHTKLLLSTDLLYHDTVDPSALKAPSVIQHVHPSQKQGEHHHRHIVFWTCTIQDCWQQQWESLDEAGEKQNEWHSDLPQQKGLFADLFCFARKSTHILQGYMERTKRQLIRHIVYINKSCYNQAHKLLQFCYELVNLTVWKLSTAWRNSHNWYKMEKIFNTYEHICKHMHRNASIQISPQKTQKLLLFDQIWATVTVRLKTWALFLKSVC